MHCADGTARMTLPRLVRTCGGDEAFWRAVAAVGWLELDETAATVAVPGWDRRFSQAAKARLQQADRARSYEDRNPGRKGSAGPPDARASDDPMPAHRRGDKRTLEVPPPPREAWDPEGAWQRLRAAWNAGDEKSTRRRPWKPAGPPEGVRTATGTPEALSAALEAVERLPRCRYFTSPATMLQLVNPGFIEKVLGGQYDEPRQARGKDREDDRPAPRVDPEFAAAREATLAREAARRAAEHARLDSEAGESMDQAKAAALESLKRVAGGAA